MGIGDLLASFVRADIKLSELEPYRRAGSDAYDLIDLTPPATWARLAAWNAFMTQMYADCLVTAASNSRWVLTDVAIYARQLYRWANVWVIETRKAQASESYRFRFDLPHDLPHWGDRNYHDARLAGMRGALETGRTRAAHDLNYFAGDPVDEDALRIRLAQIDAEAEYVARLWTEKPSAALRCTIGDYLVSTLDDAFELGHLLAQPALLKQPS